MFIECLPGALLSSYMYYLIFSFFLCKVLDGSIWSLAVVANISFLSPWLHGQGLA